MEISKKPATIEMAESMKGLFLCSRCKNLAEYWTPTEKSVPRVYEYKPRCEECKELTNGRN